MAVHQILLLDNERLLRFIILRKGSDLNPYFVWWGQIFLSQKKMPLAHRFLYCFFLSIVLFLIFYDD